MCQPHNLVIFFNKLLYYFTVEIVHFLRWVDRTDEFMTDFCSWYQILPQDFPIFCYMILLAALTGHSVPDIENYSTMDSQRGLAKLLLESNFFWFFFSNSGFLFANLMQSFTLHYLFNLFGLLCRNFISLCHWKGCFLFICQKFIWPCWIYNDNNRIKHPRWQVFFNFFLFYGHCKLKIMPVHCDSCLFLAHKKTEYRKKYIK